MPCPVAAHQDDLVTTHDGGRKVTEDVLRRPVRLGVALVHVLKLKQMLAGRPYHLEPDIRALNVGPRQIRRRQALHLLLAGVNLAGARAGRKAGDKIVQLRNLLFALLVLAFDPRPHLRLLQHHVVVAAGVGDDRLVVDVCNVGAHRVQKVTVVRDGDDGAVVPVEKVFEPVDRFEIKVVRRLVQQQRLWVAKERLREQHTHLLSALQLTHLALVNLIGDIEPLQQDGRVGFGLVAVFVADDALQLAQARAVLVGQLRLVVKLLAFFQRRPQ